MLWQYSESLWLVFGYVLALLSVCGVYFVTEKRRQKRILERFEQILQSGSADYIADERLTPTERRLITRLCELETRESKVQNAYRSISSLVADIAHQSKTPLSSILMYTEMSENGGIIRAQTEKLSFLMDSLTKLAKCEGGLIAENLSPKENSVKELVRQVIEANYASADAKNMEIRCDVPDGLTAVFDLRWTAEAVGNILDNAVKYSPDGSEITLSACAYDMFVRIDIADQGIGIPEDELCNIWKRFWRGKNAEDHSGVGIGLYLTANILNTEGGRVAAKSDENGSVFSVFLPIL
ncbi:MAG: HAMP domain-containing histidine kinase [Clostridia bacterium]|nr:HAMP domain-containing histidine kinase [Clostridia bacterium]MBQ8369780.1 HAMP domain-containing histidine kinase [Clostridia bacterium]